MYAAELHASVHSAAGPDISQYIKMNLLKSKHFFTATDAAVIMKRIKNFRKNFKEYVH